VRILYFADIRFPLERANGIQTMETCAALAARGHQVHLIVRPDTASPARDPFDFYGIARRDRLTIERAPVTGPAVPSWARRIGYLAFAAGRASGPGRADLIMTRDLTVASLLGTLPGHAPFVYESHGYAPDVAAALPDLVATAHPPSRSKLARLAKREADVWKQAHGYVTITAGLAAELRSRFGDRPRLTVVADGVRIDAGTTDMDGDAAYVDADPSSAVVGYAGHLYAWKGVDILIEALARVPDVRGLIVGGHEQEPDLARLRGLASRLGVADRLTFTGHVPPSSVASWLARAEVLALPNPASAISTHATSPLKLFEYMAAGRAIVASDLPAIREVLTDGVNACLVAAGDADALAAGIRKVIDDAALRARLAEAARASVAEYSWDRRAARLEALFDEVVAASRPL
jgi:glycosyltransferase involved in cell wall biosynthesis